MSDDMSARMIPEPEEQAVQAEPAEGDKLVRPPYNRKNATLTPGPSGNSEKEKKSNQSSSVVLIIPQYLLGGRRSRCRMT